MAISTVELSNRRALLLKSKALKKLRELRKETRSVMQRYEGSSSLDDDDQITYDDLTLSMVVLNALNDQLSKHDFLPKSWDAITLGSDFDCNTAPLLRSNEAGEAWVAYFEVNRPKDLMILIAGTVAKSIPEEKPTLRPRPTSGGTTARPKTETAASSDASLMDMIRMRMPQPCTARYQPSRVQGAA